MLGSFVNNSSLDLGSCCSLLFLSSSLSAFYLMGIFLCCLCARHSSTMFWTRLNHTQISRSLQPCLFHVSRNHLPKVTALFLITAFPTCSHKFWQKSTFVILCILILCLFMCEENCHSSSEGLLLLSFACCRYSRGFPSWAAALIADGAKCLVTVLKGWKMWGHGRERRALLFCFTSWLESE